MNTRKEPGIFKSGYSTLVPHFSDTPFTIKIVFFTLGKNLNWGTIYARRDMNSAFGKELLTSKEKKQEHHQ